MVSIDVPAGRGRNARLMRVGSLALVATLFAAACTASPPSARSNACLAEGTAVFVTADCHDLEYDQPVVDAEEDLTEPIAHRRITGHFAGTDKRFSIYLPPVAQWHGRFFQHVYPLIDEVADDHNLRFAAASGAYLVQTNGGSGYRVDAAAAKFARAVAAEHYDHQGRIFGYTWGGSGGSYQVIAAMENTTGVWDGGVPYIVGDPSSIPNNFFARAFGRLLLADRADDISEAVSPGSGRDPYATLDGVERDVLRELTSLGMPLRAMEDERYALGMDAPDGLYGFASQIKEIDPTYAVDFWSKPGYLGTENSAMGDRIRAALVDGPAIVRSVERRDADVVLTVESAVPLRNITPMDVTIPEGVAVAARVVAPTTLVVQTNSVGALSIGTQVRVDNRWYLALSSYARHQVPTRPGFATYDQYRNADGSAKYPQRSVVAGEGIARMVSGATAHTGHLRGKVIAVANLLDADAFPWHGDWYRRQVQSALGGEEPEFFRLWYTENADHIAPARTDRLVDYTGVLEQALRDLSDWVEQGRAPAPTSKYTVTDGQVRVTTKAQERGGIQPAVALTVAGGDHAVVRVGESVKLDATIVANGARTVNVSWSATGLGPELSETALSQRFSRTVSFDTPGTYYPQVRVASSRDQPLSDFAHLDNLARVRVTVID